MREEIYERVKERIETALEGRVSHVGLWNQNVVFAEDDEPWGRPAVFVEFGPMRWQQLAGPQLTVVTRAQLLLHVVTDWSDDVASGGTGCFGLLNALHGALHGLRGTSFGPLKLLESHTNHNHEDLVENIEIYEYRGERSLPVEHAGE